MEGAQVRQATSPSVANVLWNPASFTQNSRSGTRFIITSVVVHNHYLVDSSDVDDELDQLGSLT